MHVQTIQQLPRHCSLHILWSPFTALWPFSATTKWLALSQTCNGQQFHFILCCIWCCNRWHFSLLSGVKDCNVQEFFLNFNCTLYLSLPSTPFILLRTILYHFLIHPSLILNDQSSAEALAYLTYVPLSMNSELDMTLNSSSIASLHTYFFD